MNQPPPDAGITVEQIQITLEEIEVALENLNAQVKASVEFRELTAATIWNQEIERKAPRLKAELERVVQLLDAYHGVWNMMTKSPLAVISLVPVQRFHRQTRQN